MSTYEFTPKGVRERVEHTYQIQRRLPTNSGIWEVYTDLGSTISRDQARDHFERLMSRVVTGEFRLVEKKIVTTTSHVVMEQEEAK